eukprot:COSAG02_NODE_16586_length_1072_cov_37.879590_1_plen_145_part_00
MLLTAGCVCRQRANGTLQDSIIEPRRATEDVGVSRDTDGVVQADALLGKMVVPTYSPPALVVEGVTLDAFAARGGGGGDLGLVGQPASPRLGLIVSSGVVGPSASANGEALTGHQPEEMPVELLDSEVGVAGDDIARDGVVESL